MLDAESAVRLAQKHGCTYCDARFERVRKNSLAVEDGQIEYLTTRYDQGIGVRVLCDGAWGFYSTSDHTKLEQGIIDAIKAAKHHARTKKEKIKLAEAPVIEKNIKYKTKKDIDLESLGKIALECDHIIKSFPKISKSAIGVSSSATSKCFVSNEGSKIHQEFTDIIMEMTATVHRFGATQSISTTEGGRGGLEKIIDDTNVFLVAEETAKKTSMLVEAHTVKEDKATLIMNPDFVALLTHEILGHPSEADRVLGREMAWAGGAWWAGMLGKEIGSEHLNVIDDPTIDGSLGWFEFDDEGIRSQKKQLVKDGILAGHMHSRETASIFGVESNSSMRAASYSFMPLIRMSCTCIERGDWEPDEMIKDVKHGYLVSGMKVPSIDMKRYNWSISCQYANKIENGQVTDLLRDVIVVGNAPEFFSSIDACGKDFTIRPITNCGKGDPMQQMKMGNGGPSIRGIATVKSVGA